MAKWQGYQQCYQERGEYFILNAPSCLPSCSADFYISKFSVKSRLDSSSGISFTEFSYQLLQAYDFLTLHRLHNCTIQLGGSDQLGNIVSGIDMIRRSKFGDYESKDVDDPAFGVTFPLLTTASGEKFGKSAGNAIWLDPKMTSPFEVYQVSSASSSEA